MRVYSARVACIRVARMHARLRAGIANIPLQRPRRQLPTSEYESTSTSFDKNVVSPLHIRRDRFHFADRTRFSTIIGTFRHVCLSHPPASVAAVAEGLGPSSS